MVLAYLLAGTGLAAGQVKTVPAINEIEVWQQVGQQPYELTWADRGEDPHTLVDFEDMAGWELDLHGDATGELRRSREQQMWGQYVAKVLYAAKGTGSWVVARPPKPVPIPGAFDSIDVWIYGNRWGWMDDKTTPPARVSILVTDARGKEFTIEVTDIQWKQWWLAHRRVPEATRKAMALPASFSGIEISKIGNSEPRYLYFDSLAFSTEELKPLKFAAQPKRNLKPYRGMIAGLNTGEGTLPFPAREETILPSNFEEQFENRVGETGKGEFELRYKGRDSTVHYRYIPRTGTLSDISVAVGGRPAFRPLDGGGIRFAGAGVGPAAGQLVSASASADRVVARFRTGSHMVDYELRIMQKSLVLDAWCEGGDAEELTFGRVSGVSNPKLITVPYITYGDANPRVLMSGETSSPLFTSVWFDWYRTSASETWAPKEPTVTGDTAQISGGMRYLPKTDGLRNGLYERVFVTVSPVYEEVLPTVPNPPSLRQQEGSEVLWTVAEEIETFQKDHARSREIRSYGLDKIMQHSHEITWRDEGDSFTDRLKAAPQKGGDAGLKWYIAAQNSLGWLQGVYTNYTDFMPTNTNWSPDHVQRTPDGEWRRAWMRSYALKPSKAVEFDEYYAKRIKEKFGTRMSYTDVHSAVAPWHYCDYDARVPGAGTMAATFYAYGQLLLNDQRVYGPTQSEATYQWLYAGLASGHYGWVYTNVNLLTAPLDVAFHLFKIHPLECDYGMGYTSYYLSQLEPGWEKSPKRREYVDMFLATSIGYGNMGWLANEFDHKETFGIEAMVRSYYMMQQLQQQYAFVAPRTIEYADQSGRFLTPSQAHATGAIAASHLHVVYENGTEVYVNRAPSGSWTVKDHQGESVELPASGWLVFNPSSNFWEASATASGRRTDYVSSAAYEYLDGRGTWTEKGKLGATGAAVMRQRAGGLLEIIDLYGNDRIALGAEPGGTLLAYAPDGTALGKAPFSERGANRMEFKPVPGARTYVYAAAK